MNTPVCARFLPASGWHTQIRLTQPRAGLSVSTGSLALPLPFSRSHLPGKRPSLSLLTAYHLWKGFGGPASWKEFPHLAWTFRAAAFASGPSWPIGAAASHKAERLVMCVRGCGPLHAANCMGTAQSPSIESVWSGDRGLGLAPRLPCHQPPHPHTHGSSRPVSLSPRAGEKLASPLPCSLSPPMSLPPRRPGARASVTFSPCSPERPHCPGLSVPAVWCHWDLLRLQQGLGSIELANVRLRWFTEATGDQVLPPPSTGPLLGPNAAGWPG